VVRSPYPPKHFECLYRHSCPYLEGLWVLGEYPGFGGTICTRSIDVFDEDLRTRDDRSLPLPDPIWHFTIGNYRDKRDATEVGIHGDDGSAVSMDADVFVEPDGKTGGEDRVECMR